MLHDVYLSLGSNRGDRKKYIETAIEKLSACCDIQKNSKIIETDPLSYTNQPRFLNCVLLIKTDLLPESLLTKIQSIENELGRKRTIRFGPRTIDIDIIFYDDLVVTSERLIIPHPRMHERKFILELLEEIGGPHPFMKKYIHI
jgi:2-amino-4-hydroxy-6-hydroxymethyldihydropteridine diphosphokinase